MRKLFAILILTCLFSCSKQELKKPDFILGYWIRQNDKPNQKTYEIWNSDFTGIGFTMQQRDTIFKEVLSIVKKNDSLFLQVIGVNEQPTLFNFTEQTESSFTCENLKNEFPKKIKYRIESDTLKATVSNDDFSIDFVFTKSF